MRDRLVCAALLAMSIPGMSRSQQEKIVVEVSPVRSDGLDQSLLDEIELWTVGKSLPTRLLQFPDGNINPTALCGMRAYGEGVDDYLALVEDPALLSAIMLDSRSSYDSFRSAVRNLIRMKGLPYIASILREARARDPEALRDEDLATLRQLLSSPYLWIRVASIEDRDIPRSQSERELKDMETELESGRDWSTAYRRVADRNPNPARPGTTLVRYAYDGLVSPAGFDINTYSISASIPEAHLKQLFAESRGGQVRILSTENALLLYQVVDRYSGE